MNPQAAAPPKSAYSWLVLGAATSAQAAASFAMLGLAALAGFLQQEFHLSAAKTGLLITANGAAPLFSLLFVGVTDETYYAFIFILVLIVKEASYCLGLRN